MAVLVTAAEAAVEVGRSRTTIRDWVAAGRLTPKTRGPRGLQRFELADVFAAERAARQSLALARHTGGGRRRAPLACEVPTGARSESAVLTGSG